MTDEKSRCSVETMILGCREHIVVVNRIEFPYSKVYRAIRCQKHFDFAGDCDVKHKQHQESHDVDWSLVLLRSRRSCLACGGSSFVVVIMASSSPFSFLKALLHNFKCLEGGV